MGRRPPVGANAAQSGPAPAHRRGRPVVIRAPRQPGAASARLDHRRDLRWLEYAARQAPGDESRVLRFAPLRANAQSAQVQSSPGMPDQTAQTRRIRPLAAGQLALELPSALPALAVEPEWKDQTRLWGHSLHPMCSYLASFPASLVHAFIARYSRPGDVVFDPFSGRGTAPLQAAAEGRIGVGNDLNPLAHVLTAAKLEPATAAETRIRLAALRLQWAADAPALARPRGTRDPPTRAPVGLRPGRRQRCGARCPDRGAAGRGRPRIPPADARTAAAGPLVPPSR